LRKILSQISQFRFEYLKEDAYWFPVNCEVNAENTLPKSGVRIRKETTIHADNSRKTFTLVTYKTKELRQGIEVNQENEFVIAAPDGAPPVSLLGEAADADAGAAVSAFEELLKKLNLKISFTKIKKGYSYTCGTITVELSLVEKLGWFLELEIITEHDDEQTIQSAREALMSFLKKTGIGEDKIESRYYSELLQSVRGA
jgi:adenylate cyclase class 2